MHGSTAPSEVAIDDDDLPVGRFLSRREILQLFSYTGIAVVAAACAPSASGSAGVEGSGGLETAGPSTGASIGPVESGTGALPSCVAVPELTEGPYHIDDVLERADIRTDTADGSTVDGVPLTLAWVVSQVENDGCVPLEGAVVDVWHCDAAGVYSGVSERGFDTTGHDFLRGFQRTDAAGKATFQTIYPGWYSGRSVHIHFKVRTGPDASSGFELTSQLFFPDDLSNQVFANPPYEGNADTTNASDQIYGQSDGTTLLAVERSGDGYTATFSIALAIG
jgi:protocatechuate 3,4-dioxygenase beta subunit